MGIIVFHKSHSYRYIHWGSFFLVIIARRVAPFGVGLLRNSFSCSASILLAFFCLLSRDVARNVSTNACLSRKNWPPGKGEHFTNTDLYFVPELLPPIKNDTDISIFQQPGTLRFQYHYDFMPEGIVSRFMARMFYLILDKLFWKNGVILKFEDSTALVTGEPLNRRVTIAITGTCQRELLAIIRKDFDHIHSTLNMKKGDHYNEMVPCICSKCTESETPNFYKYEELKAALTNHITRLPCLKSFKEISIEELLALVAHPNRNTT